MSSSIAFHIGYHKTATTWLQQEILPRHPSAAVVVSEQSAKDPFLRAVLMEPDRHFDSAQTRRDLGDRLDDFGRRGHETVVFSSEHLSGHAGTGGYDAFRIANRLHAAAPTAKVFFVVREQVAMIESEYRQLVFEGSTAPLHRLLARPSATMRPGFDLGHYEYDLLADHYASLFGVENVRLFEFSAMLREPVAFLGKLAEFLGIESWPEVPSDVLHRRLNATLPRRFLETRRRLNHFQRSGLNPYPMIALRPVWRSPLWALATRLPAPKRPLLDDESQAKIRGRFHESNQRLSERYGINFDRST